MLLLMSMVRLKEVSDYRNGRMVKGCVSAWQMLACCTKVCVWYHLMERQMYSVSVLSCAHMHRTSMCGCMHDGKA